MHWRVEADPALWERRPFEADLLAYARSSIAPLLPLFDELRSELGGAGEAAVRRLSGAHAEWHFDAGDRASAVGAHACVLCPRRLHTCLR
jgi:hypothetical protein